uniref:Zinc knuckle CX2CX4HX4C domain-containing protein n=1 Tax=Chenopodium quinoa TaxID=63459 RepID=A0A803M882_CHEQI
MGIGGEGGLGIAGGRGTGSSKWIDMKYERLADFRFFYGRVDHTDRDCQFKEITNDQDEGLFFQYGPWLRATPRKRTKISIAERERDKKWRDGLKSRNLAKPLSYDDPGAIKLGPPGVARKLIFRKEQDKSEEPRADQTPKVRQAQLRIEKVQEGSKSVLRTRAVGQVTNNDISKVDGAESDENRGEISAAEEGMEASPMFAEPDGKVVVEKGGFSFDEVAKASSLPSSTSEGQGTSYIPHIICSIDKRMSIGGSWKRLVRDNRPDNLTGCETSTKVKEGSRKRGLEQVEEEVITKQTKGGLLSQAGDGGFMTSYFDKPTPARTTLPAARFHRPSCQTPLSRCADRPKTLLQRRRPPSPPQNHQPPFYHHENPKLKVAGNTLQTLENPRSQPPSPSSVPFPSTSLPHAPISSLIPFSRLDFDPSPLRIP